METANDILAHFGVKGMHWGVRRRKITSSSKSTKKPRDSISEDARKAHDFHSTVQSHRSTDPLMNHELQHLVNRINLEQQYVRLTTKQSSIKRGRAFIQNAISTAETVGKADKLTGGHGAKAASKQGAKLAKEIAKMRAKG